MTNLYVDHHKKCYAKISQTKNLSCDNAHIFTIARLIPHFESICPTRVVLRHRYFKFQFVINNRYSFPSKTLHTDMNTVLTVRLMV